MKNSPTRLSSHLIIWLLIPLFLPCLTYAQLPPAFDKAGISNVTADSRVRTYISPQKIFWQSTTDGNLLRNTDHLLSPNIGQALLTSQQKFCVLKSTGNERPGILLDYGITLHGGIQLVTGMTGNKDRLMLESGLASQFLRRCPKLTP